jgi:hypothetical protein
LKRCRRNDDITNRPVLAAEFTAGPKQPEEIGAEKAGAVMAGGVIWLTSPGNPGDSGLMQKIQKRGLQVRNVGHRYRPPDDDMPVGPDGRAVKTLDIRM